MTESVVGLRRAGTNLIDKLSASEIQLILLSHLSIVKESKYIGVNSSAHVFPSDSIHHASVPFYLVTASLVLSSYKISQSGFVICRFLNHVSIREI
jgi:hypothetical protein